MTDIPLTERYRLRDDDFSTSLKFFTLPLGIGLNDRRETPFSVVIQITIYLPLYQSSVFLDKCVGCYATVADFYPCRSVTLQSGHNVFLFYHASVHGPYSQWKSHQQTRPHAWENRCKLSPLEKQLIKASVPLLNLEGRAQGQVWQYQKIQMPWFPIGWFHIANL